MVLFHTRILLKQNSSRFCQNIIDDNSDIGSSACFSICFKITYFEVNFERWDQTVCVAIFKEILKLGYSNGHYSTCTKDFKAALRWSISLNLHTATVCLQ